MRTLSHVLIFLALLAGPAMAAGAAEPAPLTLRGAVSVEGDMIRIGDIFDNAGESADKAVAYAPAPGRRAIYDVYWLARVAKAMRLNWRPQSRLDRVVVDRASQLISRRDIEQEVLAQLADYGVDGNAIIELANKQLELHLPTNVPPTFDLRNVRLNGQTGRFSAIIHAPDAETPVARMALSGRVYRTAEIPVVLRQISAGEIIQAADVTWKRVRADQVSRNTVTEIGALENKQARRPLMPERPIRTFEVRTPVIVAKGALVTIVYDSPNMVLTAQGRALQNGGPNEIISVTNTNSNKVVEVLVTGRNQVAVVPAERLALK